MEVKNVMLKNVCQLHDDVFSLVLIKPTSCSSTSLRLTYLNPIRGFIVQQQVKKWRNTVQVARKSTNFSLFLCLFRKALNTESSSPDAYRKHIFLGTLYSKLVFILVSSPIVAREECQWRDSKEWFSPLKHTQIDNGCRTPKLEGKLFHCSSSKRNDSFTFSLSLNELCLYLEHITYIPNKRHYLKSLIVLHLNLLSCFGAAVRTCATDNTYQFADIYQCFWLIG